MTTQYIEVSTEYAAPADTSEEMTIIAAGGDVIVSADVDGDWVEIETVKVGTCKILASGVAGVALRVAPNKGAQVTVL